MTKEDNKIKLSDSFSYKRLLRFVLPSVATMIFTSVYGVVDGLFVSNCVGDDAFAAINLIMPVLNIQAGVGFMLGTGGSALVAKTLGEQKNDAANRYFSMMIYVSAAVGILLSAAGFFGIEYITGWLNATDTMKPYADLYGKILFAFNVSFMLQYAFQAFLIVAEKPKLGFLSTFAAGVTNMALDALFVGKLGYGVAGAATATGISQIIGMGIPLVYFLISKNSPIKLVKTKPELKPILRACANGSSEMVTAVTSSAVGILYNLKLIELAKENGVASYGVLMYVQFIFVAIFIGYAMGSAPIISYHYGACNYKELKNLFKKSTVLTVSTGILMVAAAQLLAYPLSAAFVGYNEELLNMTTRALHISTVAFTVVGFNIFSSSFFTALNDGGVSAAISFLRTFVFKTVAVLVLSATLKLDGIWISDVTAEVLSFATSIVFLFAKRNKYHYF